MAGTHARGTHTHEQSTRACIAHVAERVHLLAAHVLQDPLVSGDARRAGLLVASLCHDHLAGMHGWWVRLGRGALALAQRAPACRRRSRTLSLPRPSCHRTRRSPATHPAATHESALSSSHTHSGTGRVRRRMGEEAAKARRVPPALFGYPPACRRGPRGLWSPCAASSGCCRLPTVQVWLETRVRCDWPCCGRDGWLVC